MTDAGGRGESRLESISYRQQQQQKRDAQQHLISLFTALSTRVRLSHTVHYFFLWQTDVGRRFRVSISSKLSSPTPDRDTFPFRSTPCIIMLQTRMFLPQFAAGVQHNIVDVWTVSVKWGDGSTFFSLSKFLGNLTLFSEN